MQKEDSAAYLLLLFQAKSSNLSSSSVVIQTATRVAVRVSPHGNPQWSVAPRLVGRGCHFFLALLGFLTGCSCCGVNVSTTGRDAPGNPFPTWLNVQPGQPTTGDQSDPPPDLLQTTVPPSGTEGGGAVAGKGSGTCKKSLCFGSSGKSYMIAFSLCLIFLHIFCMLGSDVGTGGGL